MAVKGFNWGIDFSGGVLIEVKSKNGPVDVDQVRKDLSALKLDELNLQSVGQGNEQLMIRAQANNADEESQRIAVNQIKDILGSNFTFERVESVGPQVGDELKMDGILASVLSGVLL